MCSLNVSLLTNIMSRYFRLCTSSRGLLFWYISSSFRSFRFRLVIGITFGFCSLNLILFSFAHAEILLNSTLAMFSASLIDSAFIMITKSSVNATVFECLVYLKLRRELYVPETGSTA